MLKPWRKTVALAAAVVLIWFAWSGAGPILSGLGYNWSFEKLGQWADSFGALSALFTALGFAAVVYTLLLQQEQNKLTTRDLHRQNFEETFFRLLGLMREARAEVEYKIGKEYSDEIDVVMEDAERGLPAFRWAWREANYYLEAEDYLNKERAGRVYYTNVHRRYESTFGPYFRLLYTILSRIDADRFLSCLQKEQYGNILRTQLTSYELAIIALNGLYRDVSNDLFFFIVEYRLLKYLPRNSRRRNMLLNLYPEKAFEGRG